MLIVLLAIVLFMFPAISSAAWVPANDEGCTAEILFPGPSERTSWSGACYRGKIDGVGALVSSNGTLLDGLFREGVPIDVKGRLLVVREDGRRVSIGATYVGGKGDFYPWIKPADQIAQYSAKIALLIKANIVVAEQIAGAPVVVVGLKTQPNGKIGSFRLINSSGNPAWDQAVLRAVTKTEAIPFDEDGTVPAVLELSFRPR